MPFCWSVSWNRSAMPMPSASQTRSRESRLAAAAPFSMRLSMALEMPAPALTSASVKWAEARRLRSTLPMRFSSGTRAADCSEGPSACSADLLRPVALGFATGFAFSPAFSAEGAFSGDAFAAARAGARAFVAIAETLSAVT